jgi:hypothetical protein
MEPHASLTKFNVITQKKFFSGLGQSKPFIFTAKRQQAANPHLIP